MSRIQAWRCDVDGRLFEHRSDYIAHLRILARRRLEQRRLAKLEAERESFLALMGQVQNVKQLEKFIRDNWSWFFANGFQHRSWHRDRNLSHVHELVELHLSELFWNDKIRNSHSCPRGGVENFNRKPELPQHYPGWTGKISIRVRPPSYRRQGQTYMEDGWGSDYFRNTTIHTGTGGGGQGDGYVSYRYELTLWADDFPVMRDAQEKEIMWRALNQKETS